MGRRPKGSTECTFFFKVLHNDFHNKLCLPAAFIKNFNGKVPKKVTLVTSPSTRSWTASIDKDGDGSDFFFCDEWRSFTEDQALEPGEFLVFRYNGSSKFTVTVFGKNSCKKMDIANKDQAESIQVENSDETPGIAKIYDEVLNESLEKSTNDKAIAEEMASRRSNGQEVAHSFSLTLRSRNKYKLIIPSLLGLAGGDTKQDIVVLLDECGRSWPVKVIFRRQGGLHVGAGWYNLYQANRLGTSDTCRFEFTRGAEKTIRVTIFRKSARTDIAREVNAAKPPSTDTSKEAAKISEICTRKNVSSANRFVWAEEKERIIANSGIVCDNPFFSIMLRSTNVYVNDRRCYLVLPRVFSRKYLKCTSRDFTLRVSDGGTWHVRYSVGEHHMFTTGWRTFALENHLEEHDICIFELVGSKDNELKVYVIRP